MQITMCFKRHYCDNFHNYQTITNKYDNSYIIRQLEQKNIYKIHKTGVYYVQAKLQNIRKDDQTYGK